MDFMEMPPPPAALQTAVAFAVVVFGEAVYLISGIAEENEVE
jgi:hypothetical protein